MAEVRRGDCAMHSIEIEHVCVTREKQAILKDVSLTIHCGEWMVLLGRNGAGKTTLLKAILGEYGFTGRIAFKSEDGRAVRRPVTGYVPQHLSFDRSAPMSVIDLILTGCSKPPVSLFSSKQKREWAMERLRRVGAADIAGSRLGIISGGELQRVMLCLALEPMPELLVLDEPFTGVDMKGLLMFYELVRKVIEQEHVAVLMVEHDLKLVKHFADRAALLSQGVLAKIGTPAEVLASGQFRSEFLEGGL